MGNTVAVSFEGSNIKVVYASVTGGETGVTDALTLDESRLDYFLDKEKAREFIVVKNFAGAYQELFQVPAAKKKYLSKIIGIEISKRCQFKDFSSIHFLLDKKTVENRKVIDVFAFAVRNEELTELINRFASRGKKVSAVYPDFFSIASMVGPSAKNALCVAQAGAGKGLFLVKEGKVVFVREAGTLDAGVTDFDMQNIEMTVNYCRQTLRVNPFAVFLTGSLSNDYRATTGASVPIACLMPPAGLRVDRKIFQEYGAAVSALFGKSSIDISPREYREEKFLTWLLGYSTAALLLLTILAGAYTGIVLKGALAAKKEYTKPAERPADLSTVVESYERERAKIEKYRPLLKVLDAKSANPPVHSLLASVTQLKLGQIRFDSISVVPAADGALSLKVEGTVDGDGWAAAEAAYEKFTGSFSERGDLKITKEAFDLKEKRILVEAEYR
ncbi:MAG: hypothetical protein HY889_07025 [Deltaproteobacteria bacterium]|nr:hypothetical protein [Deltaproteobacteria bacterium]